ncbi:MAG: helix-hairpin-helix domain-containing protein [Halodesulfurarchaeum sp.]
MFVYDPNRGQCRSLQRETLKHLEIENPSGDIGMAVEDLTDVKYVGPATADRLESAGLGQEAIRERRVSHATLVSIGVNPGVAAKIRREHSLPWSLEGGKDLDRRAEQVRGLQDGERDWIAASARDGTDAGETASPPTAGDEKTDDEAAWREADWPTLSEARTDIEDEATWRKQSTPEPVTSLETIDERIGEALSKAGITSVRSLATCDPGRVADSTGFDVGRVTAWRELASERV